MQKKDVVAHFCAFLSFRISSLTADFWPVLNKQATLTDMFHINPPTAGFYYPHMATLKQACFTRVAGLQPDYHTNTVIWCTTYFNSQTDLELKLRAKSLDLKCRLSRKPALISFSSPGQRSCCPLQIFSSSSVSWWETGWPV